MNGQVVSETEVNLQNDVEIGQDTITSFASSLPGGFHHPIKRTFEASPEARCEDQGKTIYGLEAVFVPPSLIREYGCIRKGSKAVCKGLLHVQEATQSLIQMEEERCPSCEYSLKRTSTNLIQYWGRTVLLGEICSQRALLHPVPLLSESKHLVECYQA